MLYRVILQLRMYVLYCINICHLLFARTAIFAFTKSVDVSGTIHYTYNSPFVLILVFSRIMNITMSSAFI